MVSIDEIRLIPALSHLFADGYEVTAVYTYTSLQGNALYWRVRLNHPKKGKQIRPIHRAAGDVLEVGEPPELSLNQKPLYGLYLLTLHPGARVWVVEEEKCADALNAFFTTFGIFHDHIALTSGAASSADKADWHPLSGRSITVWPDNDASGLKYAADVTSALEALGCSVERIAADQLGLGGGEDCVEWLDAHPAATITDILALPKQQLVAPTDLTAVVARLSALSPLEYEKIRDAEAKHLGVRVSVLDKEVEATRKQSGDDSITMFPKVELWAEPVDGAALLNELAETIGRFIVCSKETKTATALWCVFTWVVDYAQVAPLVVITAPEKRCGKSQLLNFIGKLACKPLVASNISPSATYRVIEAYHPTLLIDEADSFFKDNEELRGVINSGHTRQSAYVIRNVGDNHEPTQFSTWGAKAISGIGALSDTIMDRAVVLTLRRKLSGEKVERLRHAKKGLFEELASKLARFANDNGAKIALARPELPDALNDRAQDNWEPLLAIADCAGGEWPRLACHVALTISGAEQESVSLSTELLADIKEVFDSKGVARISTTDVIKTLCNDDEKSWATYNRGKPITPRQLAKRLAEYGIASKTVRIGYDTPKGFEREQFEDAFIRYLSPVTSATAPQTSMAANFTVADKDYVAATSNQSATPEPAETVNCGVVADYPPSCRSNTIQAAG